MSFDIYFVSEKNQSIDKDSFQKYISQLRYMGQEQIYHNPDTGVYFGFAFDEVDETEETISIPTGYKRTGFVASINLIRPRFFAEEMMPIVEDICANLGLLVIDPQNHAISGDGSPKEANSQELIESWAKRNKTAIMIFKEHVGLPHGGLPPYISRDKAEYWWDYQFHYQDLTNEFDGNVFVPNILLVKKSAENEVTTAITWSDSIPFIFPECDQVILVNTKQKRFLSRKPSPKIMGVIRSDILIDKLGHELQTVNSSIGDIKALFPDQAKSAKEIFYKLKRELSPISFQGIASDNMIDVKV